MDKVIRAVSPRVEEAKDYKFLVANPESDDLQLADLGFNKSEIDEKISVQELSRVDLDNLDKRRELSFSQGSRNQEERKVNTVDVKRVREQSPSPPHVMPSLLLFSPTPGKTVATITPSERSRNPASRSPSLLRIGSARSVLGGAMTPVSPNLTPSVEESRFQSVWKFDVEGKMIKDDAEDNGESILMKDVDLMQALKDGTVLLKFGAKGQPHFRFFAVNSKLDTLLWMSGSKSFETTQIRVSDINDIKFGLGEKGLKVKGAKAYQNLGFTVVYNDCQSTLELMAKDSEELQVWVNGLIALHNASVRGEPAPESLYMSVCTNVDHQILLGTSVNGGVKATPAEVSKLERKFNKLASETEVVVVPFADVVTSRIASGIKQLKDEVSHEGVVARLRYQMWLLAVQVEALEHILRTPREATPRPISSNYVEDLDD
jgi:hypothetical protein